MGGLSEGVFHLAHEVGDVILPLGEEGGHDAMFNVLCGCTLGTVKTGEISFDKEVFGTSHEFADAACGLLEVAPETIEVFGLEVVSDGECVPAKLGHVFVSAGGDGSWVFDFLVDFVLLEDRGAEAGG